MKDPATPRKILSALALIATGWLLFLAPARQWRAALQISSVRIALTLDSGTVRFRTPVSESGQPVLASVPAREDTRS